MRIIGRDSSYLPISANWRARKRRSNPRRDPRFSAACDERDEMSAFGLIHLTCDCPSRPAESLYVAQPFMAGTTVLQKAILARFSGLALAALAIVPRPLVRQWLKPTNGKSPRRGLKNNCAVRRGPRHECLGYI